VRVASKQTGLCVEGTARLLSCRMDGDDNRERKRFSHAQENNQFSTTEKAAIAAGEKTTGKKPLNAAKRKKTRASWPLELQHRHVLLAPKTGDDYRNDSMTGPSQSESELHRAIFFSHHNKALARGPHRGASLFPR